MPYEIPKDLIVYHYTTASTLTAIVEHQTLRATCLAYLNDTQEVKPGIKTLIKWCDDTLEIQKCDYVIRALKDMKNVAKNYDIRDLFGICFASRGDQLSQWRGYANNGSGYAIGFRAYKFGENCMKLASGDFSKIMYKVGKLREELTGLIPEFPSQYTEQMVRGEVTRIISRLKHPGFKEEAEWRIVIAREFNDNTRDHGSLSDRIKLFERNGVHVPYVDIPTHDNMLLPIEKIVIGPCVGNKENAERSLNLLLEKRGYKDGEVKIVKSKIPFLS